MIDATPDYISFFQTREDVIPYKQYSSGAKVEDGSIYNDNAPENTNPVLLLEFDILNNDGFGLKRGYYEIRPDSDFTYLMFIQSGKIMAKTPVIKRELISKYGSDYEWADNKKKSKNTPNSTVSRLSDTNDIVSPRKIQPVLTDKEKKKRKNKYKKGIDPYEYIHSTVRLEFDKELNSYLIIWEKYNTRVFSILKVR